MKKIFTLLAVAAVAMSADAQTWNVTPEFVAADNATYAETTDCPVTFSADGSWAAVKADQFGTAEAYPALTHSIQGGNNPKAGGNGYKKGDNTSFPDEGCGYIFSPAKDGSLDIYAKLASGKPSFIVTSNNEHATYTGVKVDGTPCEWIAATVVEGVKGINGDGQCTLTVPVKAGVKYCLVTDGSKATLYGYNFTATGSSAIDDILVDENAPVEYFNLQGIRVANPENGLFIRRQGKNVTKVIL